MKGDVPQPREFSLHQMSDSGYLLLGMQSHPSGAPGARS
jgi:hypothetical protein